MTEEKKYCVKCGLLCNITKKIHEYDEDTGGVIYEYDAKCPKYSFFSCKHSYYFRVAWPTESYWDDSWRLLTGADYSGA